MGQDQSQPNQNLPQTTNTSVKSRPKRTKARLQDIVVVSEKPDGPSKSDTKHAIDELNLLNMTLPIIPNMTGITNQDLELLPAFDASHMTEMLLRFKYHLRECASAVAFDQNAITRRIKDIELYSTTVMKKVSDHQRQFDTAMVNFQKVDDISNFLPKVEANMQHIAKLLNDVNILLPEEERLEMLSL